MKVDPLPGAGVLALLFLLGGGVLPIAAAQGEGWFGYRDDIRIGAHEERDKVVAWGGTVVVEGRVRRDALAIGSEVTIAGEIGGDFVGLGSRVILKSTAVLKGDLVILGGTLVREDGSRVDGDTVHFKSEDLPTNWIGRGWRGFLAFPFAPVFLALKFVSLFVWALLAFAAASLFPGPISAGAAAVRRSFWPVFGTGLLAMIAFVILTAVSALLSFILIGIPLLLALTLAGLAVKIFGRVALMFLFGDSLARAFHKPGISVLGGAMLGLVVIAMIGMIPIIGLLFNFVLALLGWGLVLRTKFGTNESWIGRGRKLPVRPA